MASSDTPITFTITLDAAALRNIVYIAVEQANRLNDGLGSNPMYVDIETLLNLTNENGEPLHRIVGRWYDDLPDEELTNDG